MVPLAKITHTPLEDLHFKPKQHVEHSNALPAFKKHACFQGESAAQKNEIRRHTNLKKEDVHCAVDKLNENTSSRLCDGWHIPKSGSLMKCYF